jgi:hypothetical protein
MRLTGSSLNPVQTVEAPDLVQNDWDRMAWVYGKIEVGGNITGPIVDGSVGAFNAAFDRSGADGELDNVIDVGIMYYGSHGRTFGGCKINSYQLSVTAGEVAQFTIDFMGTQVSNITSGVPPTCEKLITWDVCSFTGITGDIQSFTLTLNNNLQRMYTIGQADLYPVQILEGIRHVDGSVSAYADGDPDSFVAAGADEWGAYTAASAIAVSVAAGTSFNMNANVALHRPEGSATTGPAIYTVNFTGVCEQVNGG